MTLSTTTSRVSYAGNGGTTTFAFAFKIWAASNLKVYLRDNSTLVDALQTYGAQYTVDIVSYPNTGNVVFGVAPAAGKTVVIVRDMPLTQELDLIASGAFAAENVERQLDKLAGEIQTLREKIARTAQIPIGSSLADLAHPEPRAAVAGNLIGFDATGLALAAYSPTTLGVGTPVSAFAATLLDDDNAAAAYQTIRAQGTVWETSVTAAPSSEGNHAAIATAFDGDLSKQYFPVKHSITGAATAGQPSSGYSSKPEIFPFYEWLYNESGHNESLSSNDGRTGIALRRMRLQQSGQGDLYAIWVTGAVGSTKAGSTSFLANPSVVVLGANLASSIAGAYLNPGEFSLDDNGFDIAAVGWVLNFNRTVGTGAKSAFWAGYRSQSNGSVEIDTHFSATGKARFGMDLSFCTFDANKAAIALKADDRVYGNVTATDASGLNRFPSAVGTAYFTYAAGLSAWNFIVGGTSVLQIYNNMLLSTQAVRSEVEFRVSTLKVVGARQTGWAADTGTDKRTANATYSGTASVGYVQAEVQGVMDAVRDATQTIKSLKADLTTHGLIGA